MHRPMLVVDNLQTCLRTARGIARPVDGVSFAVDRGETLALVGESGCGKSMTALSLMQLLPEPAGYVAGGRVLFDGEDLLDRSWDEMRSVRGAQIAMIFQEPMTSLNPAYTVGWQVMESARLHGARRRRDAWARAAEALERVGLPEARAVMRQYPHELSGGMRQRAMIAAALVNAPRLLIADEPTTALDATIQAQILQLIRALQRETGIAVLLITHDLEVVARVADRVAVMYAGKIVESGSADLVLGTPRHPYTQGLLGSRPPRARRGVDLITLEGRVPDAVAWPPGCRFAPRCPTRLDRCAEIEPPASAVDGVRACCHLHDPVAAGHAAVVAVEPARAVAA
jgi:oligopeptide/dipeptide ABC transporter ATP-binding protein